MATDSLTVKVEFGKENAMNCIKNVLMDEYGMTLDELAVLCKAKQEGRLVELPFKPPRTVYVCSKKFPRAGQAYYASAINILWDMEKGCVFGDTPESAEAKLKEMQNNG